jgi:hypothetical protein
MNSRWITTKDYDMLVEWWKFWRFCPPTREVLPDNGLSGIVVTDDNDTPICAGFIYYTNSPIAWIEFIVSNPEIKDKKIRHGSLVFLINELSGTALLNNRKVIYSSLKNENLMNKYVECGFQKGGSNTTEMIKNTWE